MKTKKAQILVRFKEINDVDCGVIKYTGSIFNAYTEIDKQDGKHAGQTHRIRHIEESISKRAVNGLTKAVVRKQLIGIEWQSIPEKE